MDQFTSDKPFYHYWQAIINALPKLLLLSFALSLLVYFAVSQVGPTYELHYSYLVALNERENTGDFRFDGYYAISSIDLFSATLAAWARSPETIVAAYREAGLNQVPSNPVQLIQAISAEKTAPQLVAITVRHKNAEVARQLTQGLRTVMQKNLAQYHRDGTPALIFKVVESEPWLGEKTISTMVIVGAVFFFTIFFSINLVVLFESLKISTRNE